MCSVVSPVVQVVGSPPASAGDKLLTLNLASSPPSFIIDALDGERERETSELMKQLLDNFLDSQTETDAKTNTKKETENIELKQETGDAEAQTETPPLVKRVSFAEEPVILNQFELYVELCSTMTEDVIQPGKRQSHFISLREQKDEKLINPKELKRGNSFIKLLLRAARSYN